MRLRYFAAGALAFVLCGFGIPGPQGAAAGIQTGDNATLGTLLLGNGTAAAPSLSFSGDTGNNVGLFLPGDGQLGMSINGTEIVRYNASYFGLDAPIRLGIGTGDLFLRRSAVSTAEFSSDGAGGAAILIATGEVSCSGNGTAASPALSIGSAGTSGLYLNSGAPAMSAASTRVQEWGSTQTTLLVPLRAPNGSASAPAYSFSNDTNSGLWSVAGDQLGLATGGTNRLTLTNSVFASAVPFRLNDDKPLGLGNDTDVFVQGEQSTLTEGANSTIFSVTTADGDYVGIELTYFIETSDGSDSGMESGVIHFVIHDTSGGVTSAQDTAVSAEDTTVGVINPTFGVDTTDDQSVEIYCNVDHITLTLTSATIKWKATVTGGNALTVP